MYVCACGVRHACTCASAVSGIHEPVYLWCRTCMLSVHSECRAFMIDCVRIHPPVCVIHRLHRRPQERICAWPMLQKNTEATVLFIGSYLMQSSDGRGNAAESRGGQDMLHAMCTLQKAGPHSFSAAVPAWHWLQGHSLPWTLSPPLGIYPKPQPSIISAVDVHRTPQTVPWPPVQHRNHGALAIQVAHCAWYSALCA